MNKKLTLKTAGALLLFSLSAIIGYVSSIPKDPSTISEKVEDKVEIISVVKHGEDDFYNVIAYSYTYGKVCEDRFTWYDMEMFEYLLDKIHKKIPAELYYADGELRMELIRPSR